MPLSSKKLSLKSSFFRAYVLPAEAILTSTDLGTAWHRSEPRKDELVVENGTSTVNSPSDTGAVLDTVPFLLSTTTVASTTAVLAGKLRTLPWTVTLPVGHLPEMVALQVKAAVSNSCNRYFLMVYIRNNPSQLGPASCQTSSSYRELPRGQLSMRVNSIEGQDQQGQYQICAGTTPKSSRVLSVRSLSNWVGTRRSHSQ